MNATYLALTLVVGPLIGGGLVYFIQSRIRVREARETAGIQAEATAAATPYQVFQQQLIAKDAQIATIQVQHHTFVETQMARNDATTQAVLALAEQVRVQTGNLKEISVVLQSHREESGTRSGRIYEKIGLVNERLAGLEAGLKNSLETAQRAAEIAKEAVEAVNKVAREASA